MAIFPEGTTTDGSQVKHFHASLLQPAIDAQTPIYPVAIRYHDKDYKPNQDAAYIDDMSFIESMWKILSSRDLQACLTTTTALPTQFENRRTLATQAHQCISYALSIEPPVAAENKATQHSSENHQNLQSPYSLLLYAPIKPVQHKAL
jgi:1-acyl-sn-glycerol-3-phosphate acyltransferase